MRTTLTLDDDVAALLKREQATTGKPFKDIVNEALRKGLSPRSEPRALDRYRTSPADLGRCRMGSLDSVADILAIAEREDHR